MRCSTVNTDMSRAPRQHADRADLAIVTEHTPVPVQLGWSDWKSSEVCFGDLRDIHWFQPPDAPRPLLHAYVCPTKLPAVVAGPTGGPATEPLRVCVLKSHTIAPIYFALVTRANVSR